MNRSEYQILLRDPRWQVKRGEILKARNYRCEDCGATRTRLEVHHGYYRVGRMPWEYPDAALHVLCSDCHGGVHQGGDSPTRALISGIASGMAVPPKPVDPRKTLWDMAKANERNAGASKEALMKLLSWLWYRKGVHDTRVLERVSMAMSTARNPYALFQSGGVALEAMIGASAVENAEAESARHKADDVAAGLGRMLKGGIT